MRYLIIAVLSLVGFGLICLNEYYNDSPKGGHYLEFPIEVAFIYFGIIYVLLLGIHEVLKGIYRLGETVSSLLRKRQ